jgi:hypothetical protein
MTPKEKAINLVDSYRNILMNEDTECGNEILCSVIAKQCALIAVDELLELNHPYVIVYKSFEDNIMEDMTQEYYWKQVKHELEKL